MQENLGSVWLSMEDNENMLVLSHLIASCVPARCLAELTHVILWNISWGTCPLKPISEMGKQSPDTLSNSLLRSDSFDSESVLLQVLPGHPKAMKITVDYLRVCHGVQYALVISKIIRLRKQKSCRWDRNWILLINLGLRTCGLGDSSSWARVPLLVYKGRESEAWNVV